MTSILNSKSRHLTVAILAFFISISFVLPEFSPVFSSDAYAQVRKPKKRKNIFQLLFGNRGSLNNRRIRNKAKRIKLRNARRTTPAASAAPKIVIAEKNEAAAKILIAGDFMAGGLAQGLVKAYAESAEIVVVDISKGLSGFVRDDVKDWPKDIAGHIDEIKPIAIVFLGGMNDRQQMRLSDGRVNKLTEPWLAAYNKRTQTLAQSVQAKNIPFFWVGLPPVRSNKMTSDYLVFNEIYRTQAEAVKGTYIDVWDGYTNAEGQFVSAGPDINGQIKRLRASDGINMNKTGKRKLAFYVKRALNKITGTGTASLLASLPGIEDRRPQTPQYNPAKTGRTIVYSLDGPTLDGGTILEGAKLIGEGKESRRSVSYQLVNSGRLPKTHRGRVDHYGIVANEAAPNKTVPEDNKLVANPAAASN